MQPSHSTAAVFTAVHLSLLCCKLQRAELHCPGLTSLQGAVLQCCSDVRPAKLVSWLARGCVRPGHHLLLARCDSEQTRWRRSGAWVCTARTSCSQHVTPTRHSYYSSRCKSVLCSAYCSKHTADTNPHKCHGSYLWVQQKLHGSGQLSGG